MATAANVGVGSVPDGITHFNAMCDGCMRVTRHNVEERIQKGESTEAVARCIECRSAHSFKLR